MNMSLHAARTARLLSATAALVASGSMLLGCAESPQQPVGQPPATSVQRSPLPGPTPPALPGDGSECPVEHCVSVVVTGDLLFHPGLWNDFRTSGDPDGANFDFMPLLDGQRRYLQRADLAICQMETPLAAPGGPYSGYPIFSIPPEVAFAAKAVGYDACTTASNHSVDAGTEGLVRTLDTLDAAGLPSTGTYRAEGERDVPLIVLANGVKVAIIAATFSLNGLHAEHDWQVDYPLDPEREIAKARAAREAGAQLVLGAAHVGTEYATEPDHQQIAYARALVDSGEFDFVYQHHTHSVLPLELRGDTWIAYGLGNTISESAPSERRVNNEFLMVRVQFARQADGSWSTSELVWNVATNTQGGAYTWCSVASDAPQGVCQSAAFDADVLSRSRATIDKLGAAESGAREWLITEEESWAAAAEEARAEQQRERARNLSLMVRALWHHDEDARIWDGTGFSAPDLSVLGEDPPPQ